MPENLHQHTAPGLTGPLTRIFTITPGTALSFVTRAIMVGASGTVTLTTLGGDTITTLPLAPGVWHPIMATAVATGGTATQIQGAC